MPITELPPPEIDLEDQLNEITWPKLGEAVAHGARRFGYLIAALVNGVVLYIVHNLVDWGWFGFITDDFDQVVPALTLAIGATIMSYLLFMAYDRLGFKATMNILVAAINIWATFQVWDVFPFDFSHMSFNWAPVGRGVLVLAIIGTIIGASVEAARLVRGTRD